MFHLAELTSQRGKTLIVLNNFKFNEHSKLSSGEVKWKCVNRKCKANIYTVGESSSRIVSKSNLEHNHAEITSNVLQRQSLAVATKRKAVEDIYEKPTKIIHRCIDDSHQDLQLQDLKYVKKSMYVARRKILPPLPTNIGEVQVVIDNINPITKRDENFLLLNNKQENIVIFSCINNLKYLSNSNILYMDGTFEYCPKYFLQLFTLHGYFNGHYIPLVYCLLKDKRANTYQQCFQEIQNLCNKQNFSLQPTEVVVDFENAIHNAIKEVWPETKIVGCRFHLTQSWWRKIQKCGLAADYKNKSSEIGQWLRYCFGLMFLDPTDVSECFVFDLLEIKPTDERCTVFADYLVDTYISEEAAFPPEIWAAASAQLNRTTNACESYHAHLNRSFYITHPHIYTFVNTLLQIQTETYIKCNSINTPFKFQNITSRKRYMFLKNKIDEYKNCKYSRFSFIKIMSHYYSDSV